MKEKYTLDSTVGEIIGEIEGVPPNDRLLNLIGFVLIHFAPEKKWFVDRSIFNDRVDITMSDAREMRGISLFLEGEDIGMRLFLLVLNFTHHPEWHKPISLSSLTLAPFDRIVLADNIGTNASGWKTYPQWYPRLVEQEEFFKSHSEKVNDLFQKAGVLEQVNEIRRLVTRI